MKKYKCIKSFSIDSYDDEGFYTGKSMSIEQGEIFEVDEESPKLIADDDAVRLVNDNCWIEISNEHLQKCFEEDN